MCLYSAARIIRKGQSRGLYDYNIQLADQQEFTGHDEAMVSLHPPFEALFFLPLSYFSYRVAYVVAGVTNLLLLGTALWLLREYIGESDTGSHLAIVAQGFFPVMAALWQGQDVVLLLLLFTLAFFSLKRRRHLRAGCMVGLGLFRFQVAIPFALV